MAEETFDGAYSFYELTQVADACRFLRALSPHERRMTREAAHVSRKELAALTGVPVARIASFENGSMPSGQDAVKFACAFKAMEPPEKMTAEERARVIEYFTNEEVCPNCRGVHNRACPRVRSVSYHDNGTLKSVEYWPDGQWPQEAVIFRDSPELHDD